MVLIFQFFLVKVDYDLVRDNNILYFCRGSEFMSLLRLDMIEWEIEEVSR